MSYRELLRRPGVTRLLVASLLLETADWVLLVAIPLWVFRLSGSPLATAVASVAALAPTLVVGPLAGVLVDRANPWRLMAIVAGLQVICLLPLLAVTSAGQLGLVYASLVSHSVTGSIAEPARPATLARLVPAVELTAVTNASGICANLARVCGAPLGGLALGTGGLPAVLLTVGAITSVATTLLLARARSADSTADDRLLVKPDTVVSGLREGMQIIRTSTPLRQSLGVLGLLSAAQGSAVVLLVLFATRDLGLGDTDVSLIRGVQAAGALAAGLALGLLARRINSAWLSAVSLGLSGVLFLITWNLPAVSVQLTLYLGLGAATGMTGMIAITGLRSLLQLHSPPTALGRIASAALALTAAAQALGTLLAGLMGTGIGLTAALQIHACIHIVAAGLTIRMARNSSRT